MRHELPLIDYLQVVGNYNVDYRASGFYASGYYDPWSVDTTDLDEQRKSIILSKRASLIRKSNFPTGFKTYDFLFHPQAGIMSSVKPLAPNCEMKLTFDRACSDLSLIAISQGVDNPFAGKSLEIRNPFIRSRYYSTPYLRNYFGKVFSMSTINYRYDEIQVYQKNLPLGEKNIRISNIIGGQTPQYLFAAVLESEALQGNCEMSLTKFSQHNIIEFDLLLNGNSVNGYPLASSNGSSLHGNKLIHSSPVISNSSI